MPRMIPAPALSRGCRDFRDRPLGRVRGHHSSTARHAQFRLTRLFSAPRGAHGNCLLPRSSRKARETFLGFYARFSSSYLWASGGRPGFWVSALCNTGPVLRGHNRRQTSSSRTSISVTSFFTLGLGDVVPRSSLARALVVIEAGFGFGFLAAVIGYLPFIYGSFLA